MEDEEEDDGLEHSAAPRALSHSAELTLTADFSCPKGFAFHWSDD